MAPPSKPALDVVPPEPLRADGFIVRPLAPGEARMLASVMPRSFGGLAGMMFSPGKAAFVAEQGGRFVGGVTLGAFRIVR